MINAEIMSEDAARRALAALSTMLDRLHLAVPDELPLIVQESGRKLGWEVVPYLVDYEQRRLRPMPVPGYEQRQPLGIDSTIAGRAYRTVTVMRGRGADTTLWLPLLDGVERLGVLEITFDESTDPDSASVRAKLRWFATLVGHLVAVKMPYSDTLDLVRRSRQRTVASDLVWRLLPPLTFGCDGLVVAAALEPCYEAAGDSFDYAVDHDRAQLAIFDPAGHDMRSGLMSAATLAAYRTARSGGADLVGIAELIDRTLIAQFGPETFVTGVLIDLDRATGRLRYVGAGHPEPLVLRRGKVVRALSGGRRLPFGMASLGVPETTIGEAALEPGDWLVLYTDGVVEARGADGALFGLDRLVHLLERSAAERQPAPESLRRVVHAVVDHQGGVLQDDSTLMLVQWKGRREDALWPELSERDAARERDAEVSPYDEPA